VYADATATFLSAMNLLVTTSIIKSDVVPALWAGAASLISGGDGCEVSDMYGLSLRANILDVVTIVALRLCPSCNGGRYFVVSEPART